ncbi:hypothetical protein ACFL5D_05245 [Candidatus Neomarinimicrobiota bacterium]
MKIFLKTFGFIFINIYMISCSKDIPTTHIVFIDYSISSSIFEGNNPEKIVSEIGNIWDNMSSNDKIYIYPIHKYTATASHIMKAQKEINTGDLNGLNNEKKIKSELLLSIRTKIFKNTIIPKSSRMYTNIYPLLWKILNHFDINGNVSVYIISDMIHEDENEKLNELFISKTIHEVANLALQKYEELELFNAPKPSTVHIKIPGTVQGSKYDEKIRLSIIQYWKELFKLCSYVTVFEDL